MKQMRNSIIICPSVDSGSSDSSSKFLPSIKNKIKERKEKYNKIRTSLFTEAEYSRNVCTICFHPIKENQSATIGKCNHFFCRECLTQYILYKIYVTEEVTCPEEICDEKLQTTSSIFHYLPKQILSKYKQQQLWRKTINNPYIKICPSQTCEDGLVNLRLSPPTCQKCKKKFCSQCMMEYHSGPCDENFQLNFQEWRRCPSCKRFIEKEEGCNHMTCQCKYEFCFVCMEKWTDFHYSCIQEVTSLYCFQKNEELYCFQAFLYLVILLIGFPLFILIFIFGGVVLVFFMSGTCLFVSPLLLSKEFPSKWCLLAILIFLPVVMVLGAIILPIIFLIYIYIPEAWRKILMYKNSIVYVVDKMK